MLSHNGRYYLVSAGHVIDHLQSGEPLFMNASEGLLLIEGTVCTTASADKVNRKDDPLDIGAIELDPAIYHRIDAGNSLTLDKLDRTGDIHGKHGYVVAGYPNSKNRNAADLKTKTITPSAYVGICWEAQDAVYEQLKQTRSLSLALNFNLKSVYSLEGEKRAAPALNGLSGAPVWGFTKKGVARVAGILVEHHQGTKKCIVVTRSMCVAPLIEILRQH
jgi:hypothetical protein